MTDTNNATGELMRERIAYLCEVDAETAAAMAAGPALLKALEGLAAFIDEAVRAGVLNAEEMVDNGLLGDSWEAIRSAKPKA